MGLWFHARSFLSDFSLDTSDIERRPPFLLNTSLGSTLEPLSTNMEVNYALVGIHTKLGVRISQLKARAFLWVWMGWVWNRPCEILGNPFMKLPLAMTKMLFGFFWKNPCYFPNLPIGNPKRNTQKFTQNDPHECSWAVIKTLVGWAIWGIILRSYVGAVISQDKDTY